MKNSVLIPHDLIAMLRFIPKEKAAEAIFAIAEIDLGNEPVIDDKAVAGLIAAKRDFFEQNRKSYAKKVNSLQKANKGRRSGSGNDDLQGHSAVLHPAKQAVCTSESTDMQAVCTSESTDMQAVCTSESTDMQAVCTSENTDMQAVCTLQKDVLQGAKPPFRGRVNVDVDVDVNDNVNVSGNVQNSDFEKPPPTQKIQKLSTETGFLIDHNLAERIQKTSPPEWFVKHSIFEYVAGEIRARYPEKANGEVKKLFADIFWKPEKYRDILDGFGKWLIEVRDSDRRAEKQAAYETALANKPRLCACGGELQMRKCPKCGNFVEFDETELVWKWYEKHL